MMVKAYPKDSDDRFMDLRDYFAARAMQAYMTRTIGISGFDEDVIAEMSYKVAEAMMRARDE